MRSAAAIEERLLVPAYASRWSSLSVAAHRVLAFPLQMRGPVRRRTFEVADRALTVLEVGRSKLTEPLVARLLGDLPPAASETARWLGDPGEAGAADLVLAEVHRWVAPRFRRAGWIVVPDQVRWRGELSALPPPVPSHSLKDDLRRGALAGLHPGARERPGGLGRVRGADGDAARQRALRRRRVAAVSLSLAAVR